MKGDPINLAEIYNARLATEGKPLRWRYRRPNDLTSELVLESLIKPVNLLQQNLDLDLVHGRLDD